jgi:hypothetical protein
MLGAVNDGPDWEQRLSSLGITQALKAKEWIENNLGGAGSCIRLMPHRHRSEASGSSRRPARFTPVPIFSSTPSEPRGSFPVNDSGCQRDLSRSAGYASHCADACPDNAHWAHTTRCR